MNDNPMRLCGLPAWRLKRVLSYIDANIEKRVGLSQIAQAAGFSRMHFARQFRVSTGLRPHEYLLRRRVEHAQELLVHSHSPVACIARASGFSTQAHFTSVFRRFVGKPPARWRRAIRAGAAPAGLCDDHTSTRDVLNARVWGLHVPFPLGGRANDRVIGTGSFIGVGG